MNGRFNGRDIDRRQLMGGLAAVPLAPIAAALLGAKTEAAQKALDLAPVLTQIFKHSGERGVIAFESGDKGSISVSDLERANSTYLPASTFKIPNTVIAIESGVVASLDDPVFKWDGRIRSIDGAPVDAWNRDQPLRDAFRNSTIWVYQEIARKVGPERMAHYVSAFNYGNHDISGVPIDQFWLSGRLRISALEQIAFLDRLRSGTLPVSARAHNLTKEAMVVERTEAYVLRGKTGWAFDQKIGWFVGWIETTRTSRLFALNLDVARPQSLKARIEIVKLAARELGCI